MIAVFPISRCLVEQEIRVCESLSIWPPGQWYGLPLVGEISPAENPLTEVATVTSGISSEVIAKSSVIDYQEDAVDLDSIGLSHKSDLFMLQKVAAECESRLDVARFDMCRLDLPETVFGRVGTWRGSNGASGCVFFDIENNKALLVGGRYLVSTVTAGIGLDFDGYCPTYQHRTDEIGTVVKQVLRVYRGALEASDWTTKFIQCVRLFEVLSDPFQIEGSKEWKKVRSNLSLHLVENKTEYLQIGEQFKLLENIGVAGERGLRERVIHHGELLENIYDSTDDLGKLFKQIDKYVKKVLFDLMGLEGQFWQQVIDWRSRRMSELGIS